MGKSLMNNQLGELEGYPSEAFLSIMELRDKLWREGKILKDGHTYADWKNMQQGLKEKQ